MTEAAGTHFAEFRAPTAPIPDADLDEFPNTGANLEDRM